MFAVTTLITILMVIPDILKSFILCLAAYIISVVMCQSLQNIHHWNQGNLGNVVDTLKNPSVATQTNPISAHAAEKQNRLAVGFHFTRS
ncbi:MAG: hypothetical protein R3C11_07670 [Planctomycetaceae bacterium]